MTNSLKPSDNLKNVPEAINILSQYGDQLGNALAKLSDALKLNLHYWKSAGFVEFEEPTEMWYTPIWDRDTLNPFSLIPLLDSTHYFINRKFRAKGIKGIRKGDAFIAIDAFPNGASETVEWPKDGSLTSLPIEAPFLRIYVHMVKEDSRRSFNNLFDDLDDYPTDVDGFFKSEIPNLVAWVGKFELGKFLEDQQEVISALGDVLQKMVSAN
ncbi:MAG: hypothetical protein LBF22_08395 [Deltaproteobacteria bacterium]|jgi:hypothetical protein|nr:hypothetical protein [Deltaproteobacteria bacterium]